MAANILPALRCSARPCDGACLLATMTDPTLRPPTVDAAAALRWQRLRARVDASPWLHEEVARRMAQRLQWMARAPEHWLHWAPWSGGMQGHTLVQQQFAQARWQLHDSNAQALERARLALRTPWWNLPQRRRQGTEAIADQTGMVWANMALHTSEDPVALLRQWHQALRVDGFVMFSCLGPDTLRELRPLYAAQGWGEPSHGYTDMHDWGDLLVQCGFAEPVMDMERITLSYSSPEAALDELRTLGRNLHAHRFAALRTPRWRKQLLQALQGLASGTPSQRLELTFEVVYGHAFKPAPRMPVAARTEIGLDQMRAALRKPASAASTPPPPANGETP